MVLHRSFLESVRADVWGLARIVVAYRSPHTQAGFRPTRLQQWRYTDVNTGSFVGIHHLAIENAAPRFGRDVKLLNHPWVIAITIWDIACDEDDLFVVGIIETNHRPSQCAG